MIQKIIRIKNVGLFANASPPVELKPTTLLYAENGRGKSTLSSMLRACALNDAGRVNAKKTLDTSEPPEIELLVKQGSSKNPVTFNSGAWSSSYPDIVVFDSEFVDQNVYSGFEVRTDQRQSLLGFALGDDAVQLKDIISTLTKDIEVATKNRSDAEKRLSGYTSTFNLKDFIALKPVENIEIKIGDLRGRIEAAKRSEKLLQRQNPAPLPLIDFDLDAVIGLLERNLGDLEKQAESAVKMHLGMHEHPGLEDWVSSGQVYIDNETCPFCGQSLTGISLIGAYRSYFNQEYQNIKTEVAATSDTVRTQLGNELIVSRQRLVETNNARIDAWRDQISLTAPGFEMQEITQRLRTLQQLLLKLVEAKQAQPLEQIGTAIEFSACREELGTLNSQIVGYNQAIAETIAQIGIYRDQLSSDNIAELQTTLKQLETRQKRFSPEVIELIAAYQSAEAQRKALDKQKTQIREKLDGLMQATLAKYQVRVNELLECFGAEFYIEKFKHNYKGSGEPRSEYGLSVRGKSVKLGSRDDMASAHSFGSALSEADKRTLAFAFFYARLERNKRLQDCVVVLDDPVSSLDSNRRLESIRLIADLVPKCRQLIVLSHDAYFIRDLRDKISADHQSPEQMTLYRIHRTINKYSAVGECDIDELCASDYYRNHALVASFVNGSFTGDIRDVARAIRPMLEGCYHRRYPGVIRRKNGMFGQVIDEIENAKARNRLINLQSRLQELSAVNGYASNFHHDTNPNASRVIINDSELLQWAKRALDLIYK